MGTPRSFPAESHTDDRAVHHEGGLGLRRSPVSWDGTILPVNICLCTAQSTAVGNVSGALGKLAAQAVRVSTPSSDSQPLLAAKAGLASELPSLIFVGLLLFPWVASTSPTCNWTVMGSKWRCLKSGSRQTSDWNLTLNSDCESYSTKQCLSGSVPPSWGPGSSGWGEAG